MSIADDMQAIHDRLREGGYPGWDDEVPTTPPASPYWCLFTPPGSHSPELYHGSSTRQEVSFRVIYAARTTGGLLDVVAAGRRQLLDWRPNPGPSCSPIHEVYAAEPRPDGPSGDRRRSLTILYRYYTRSTHHG